MLEKFTRLTPIKVHYITSHRQAMWLCKCDCGNEVVVRLDSLTTGNTKSCGCLKMPHGDRRQTVPTAVEYNIWCTMKARCNNVNNQDYKYYGGRGIKVCDRWFNSYKNFLEDMGRRPSRKHSIDRINNDGNYEPSNCRWATASEQAYNRRAKSC